MDWIGDMGGVPGIILDMFAMIIGGYAAFHAVLETTGQLYKVKDKTRLFDVLEEDGVDPEDKEDENKLD